MNKPLETFDSAAASYDHDFTDTKTAAWLRRRVHDRLDLHFKSGDKVLELGCGTGADALYLAQRGVQVTATDVSPAMLAVAQTKVGATPSGCPETTSLGAIPSAYPITFEPLDMRSLSPEALNQPFEGAFSNFGALNCLDDWRPLAVWLAKRIKPGGVVGFGVMGKLCLWEIGWHGLHLNFKTALRRFRRSRFQLPDTEAITINYPTAHRLRRAFAPEFEFVSVRGIGVFLPPSDVYPVIEKRPHLYKTLIALEQRFAAHRPFAGWGDHYWLELRRI